MSNFVTLAAYLNVTKTITVCFTKAFHLWYGMCSVPFLTNKQDIRENMTLKALALACALLAGNASAAVLIDFEGIAAGSSVGDTYAQYGIHFSGGTVQYNQLGAYVAGQVSVRFDTPINGIRFAADGLSYDTNSTICFTYGCEPQMLESLSVNPTTGTGKNLDWYVGQVWETYWPWPEITSISFNTVALDNLRFESAAVTNEGTVPEPGSIALLGLGALGLFGARRLKSE
jgi:hypothetical protein